MPATYDKDYFSSAAPAAKPKRIVVCCDGTWQSATTIDPKKGCPSNVARISRVLAKAGLDRKKNEWQQVVYYDAGVGTGDITGAEANRQGSQGLGLLENVLEAYNFIVGNYSAGDELYFFGFSRGAYTVRSVAGLVQDVGIIQAYLMPDFLQHYGNFIRGKDFSKPFAETEHWKKFISKSPNPFITTAEKVVIQVIGVWDTVGALGIPDMGHYIKIDNSKYRKAYQFHDTDLSPAVRHAYHALALDERREPFSPCLWCVKEGNDVTKLVQCWFPGAHINVGGGNSENVDKTGESKNYGDREQLASVAYAWMLDRIRPHLALDETALAAQLAEIEATLKPKTTKEGGTKEQDDWTWGEIEDSYTKEYQAMSSAKIRTPSEYHPKEVGFTVERVHPAVHFRKQYHADLKAKSKVYHPMAMEGWERIYDDNGKGKGGVLRKGWKWVKYQKDAKGKPVLDKDNKQVVERGMWEFEISSLPEDKSIEQWLINRSWNIESCFREVKAGWDQ